MEQIFWKVMYEYIEVKLTFPHIKELLFVDKREPISLQFVGI